MISFLDSVLYGVWLPVHIIGCLTFFLSLSHSVQCAQPSESNTFHFGLDSLTDHSTVMVFCSDERAQVEWVEGSML